MSPPVLQIAPDDVQSCKDQENSPEPETPLPVLQIATTPDEALSFKDQGYTQVDGSLNANRKPEVYLLFIKDRITEINRIQFSFRKEMEKGLADAGFTKIDKRINEGAPGEPIYLWYMSGKTVFDHSISDLQVTTGVKDESALFKCTWEHLGCDLNRGAGGDPVYLWVKRSKPTYVFDIRGSNSFSEDVVNFDLGYVRVDEDTNQGVKAAGLPVFLWYHHSTYDSGANALEVSLGKDEEKDLRTQGYIQVHVNLNEGTIGEPVYLWYKFGKTNKIKNVTVLVGDDARNAYKDAGCKVLEKNLNCGSDGKPLYIAYH